MVILRALVFGPEGVRYWFVPSAARAVTRWVTVQPTYLTGIEERPYIDPDDYDVVVIYDTSEYAPKFAHHLCDQLRERAVIISNAWEVTDQMPYVALGYVNFGLVSKLSEEEPYLDLAMLLSPTVEELLSNPKRRLSDLIMASV